MRVRPTNVAIRVEVANPGPPFDPGIPVMPSAAKESGYGLSLVDTLAARWGVEQDTTHADPWTNVWFEIEPQMEGDG
jgi:hypothetical protein